MGLFGIALDDLATARRRIQDRWPGRYFEIWPDVFERGLYWVGTQTKALLDEGQVPHGVRFSVDDDRVPIFYGGGPPPSADVLPAPESVRTRALAGRGIGVALVEEGGARPSVEPAGPEDAYFSLTRPGASRYFIWRLFRSKEDARTYLRKHKVVDEALEAWLAASQIEQFADLVGPEGAGGSPAGRGSPPPPRPGKAPDV